jgi:molecular chaperone Hsp33
MRAKTLEALIGRVFGELGAEIAQRSASRSYARLFPRGVERALISIGEKELVSMIEEDHGAEVACRFCDKKYMFSESGTASTIGVRNKERR